MPKYKLTGANGVIIVELDGRGNNLVSVTNPYGEKHGPENNLELRCSLSQVARTLGTLVEEPDSLERLLDDMRANPYTMGLGDARERLEKLVKKGG